MGSDGGLQGGGKRERGNKGEVVGARKGHSPYLDSRRRRSGGERLYPNCCSALESSCPSIEPERSRSKWRKTFCQSLMYFHNPENSLNPIVPLRSVAYVSL